MKSRVDISSTGAEISQNGRGIRSAYSTALFSLFVVTVPLLLLSGVLLGLIFTHRIDSLSSGYGNLQYPAFVADADAYYVDFSATRLITVASWTSTVAPLGPGFLMTLISFPVAYTLRRKSENTEHAQLPTPYQLNILLDLSTARIGALWQWSKYFFWKSRSHQIFAVKLSTFCLVIALGIAYLILAADTWLHVTTSSVNLPILSPSAPSHTYGRTLSQSCRDYTSITSNPIVPCIVHLASSDYIDGVRDAIETINNISSTNLVAATTQGNMSYSYLAPSNPRPNVDFRASTVALHTQCQPISKKCNLAAAFGAFTPYKCTDAFQGDLTRNDSPGGYNITFFEDSDLKVEAQRAVNPFHVGFAGVINTVAAGNESLYNDPEIVHPLHGGDGIIAQCTVTVYDFTYSYLNGTVTSVTTSLADERTTELMIGPMMYTGYSFSMMNLALQRASLVNTSQQFIDTWASTYNLVTLGLSTGAFDAQLSLEEQTWANLLVARVPKVPLFALLSFNVLFVLYGFVLFIFAMLSRPQETSNVQARLSLAGLVASKFEGEGAEKLVEELEDMFSEREGSTEQLRVALEKTELGGWAFKTIANDA